MSESNSTNSKSTAPADIAIIGMGFRFPGDCSDPESLFSSLISGFDAITNVPKSRWSGNFHDMDLISNKFGGFLKDSEWKNFDNLHFGISSVEAPYIDPQQRLLLNCVYEALEDAQIKPDSVRSTNTGVFIGASNVDYTKLTFQDNYNISPYSITGTNTSLISNRISYCFDFRGPSLTIDTACSSSLVAVNLGVSSIINGDCEISVCGGVNALFDPSTSIAFSKLGVLNNENGRCNTFSDKANGYVRSEGAGVIILKSLEKAEKDGDRIYGVIKACSVNEDGTFNKTSITTPSSESQSNNIKSAMNKSNFNPNDIYYIEAHGTGTKVGDKIELNSISNVFSNDRINDENIEPLYVGSIKSNIGHLESAAGIASVIKCCLMLKNRVLVPSINCTNLNPDIPFDSYKIQVVRDIQMFPIDKTINIGINSFGFGGSNGHLIIQEYNKLNNEKKLIIKEDLNKNYLIPISAKSKLSLEKYLNLLKTNNYQDSILFKELVQHQILSKQFTYSNRMTVIASDWQEFIKSTNEIYSQHEFNSTNEPILVYVFCGQGSQWHGMIKQLYSSEKVFRDTINYVDSILSKYFGYSVYSKFASIDEKDNITINEPIVAQPSLFLLQVGLIELFKYWGIVPSISIGHSFGEVTSYYCSGLITLESACKIVYIRAKYQNQTIGSGKMLVCSLSHEQWLNEYSKDFKDLEIACVNSSDSIVVTGNEIRLRELVESRLTENQIFNVFLRSPCSFHSSKQEVIKESVLEELKDIESLDKTMIPLFSTVNGKLVEEKLTANTIYNNLREPVLFKDAIDNLIKFYQTQDQDQQRKLVFVEIAPHPTLGSLISTSIKDNQLSFKNQPLVLSPLNRKDQDDLSIKRFISQLYFNGINVNFKFQLNNGSNNNNSYKDSTSILPRYQWDVQEYWSEPTVSKKNRLEGPSTTLLGNKVLYSYPIYQSILDLRNSNYSYLLDHMVQNKSVFPGSAYIDIILQFHKSISSNSSSDIINIESIQFFEPLLLNKHKLITLQSVFEPIQNKKSSFNVSFFTKEEEFNNNNSSKLTIDDNWSNKCKSIVQFSNSNSNNNDQVNLELIKSNCNITSLSKVELYDKISKELNLNYNENFQLVESISIGENQSFAKLVIPSSSVHSDLLNSCLLDNCFHGLLGLISEKGSYVFKSAHGITIYQDSLNYTTVNEEVYLSTSITKSYPFSTEGTCKLFNQHGRLILSIDKFIINSTNPKPVKSKQLLESPLDETISIEYQSKDSPIPNISKFDPSNLQLDSSALYLKSTILKDQEFDYYCAQLVYNQLVSSNEQFKEQFESFLNQGGNIDESTIDNNIKSLMNNLNISTEYFRFFKCILLILINNYQKIINIGTTDQLNAIKNALQLKYYNSLSVSNDYEFQCIEKSSGIIPKLLFNNDKQASMSLFENELLSKFYGQSISTKFYLEYVASLVLESIKPFVKEKRVFKILEIGAGTGSLTNFVLDKIEHFLTTTVGLNNRNCIIEYNFTDVSSSFFSGIQQVLSSKYPSITFKFSVLDLEKDIKEQQFFYSDYDIVLMAYVLHAVSNIQLAVQQIYDLLSPRGWLLFIEPKASIVFSDLVFGNFSQWWNYQDSIRSSHCSLESDQWSKVLAENGFISTQFVADSNSNSHSFIIHSQKHSISQMTSNSNNSNILYITNNDNDMNNSNDKLINELKSSNSMIDLLNLKQLSSTLNESSVLSKLSTSSSIIIFNLELLELNYKFELNQFIQILNYLGNNSNIKTSSTKILIITKSTYLKSRNFLSRSLISICRTAMNEYSNLNIITIDIDSNDYSLELLLKPIQFKFSDNEFILKNGLFFVSRFMKNQQPLLLSSTSFESNNLNLNLTANRDLELVASIKQEVLLDNQVEIQVVSVGINFKDNLFYKGLLPQDIFRMGNILSPPFGLECSGVISRVGSAVSEFSVGDQVFGFARHSISSHVITNQDLIIKKPSNLTHEEAASLPVVYCTSYYSLFNVSQLHMADSNSTKVLIHSATGGIGLSALNLLKMKNFNQVYATVGSKEKEDYLKQNYPFIKSIYSSKTFDYANELENKVDMVFNTLDGNFIESNFKALKSYGQIVDISVTHIYNNQQIGLGNFKFDRLYTAVDLERLIDEKPKLLKSILSTIANEISAGKLDKLPIHSFNGNDQIKESVEFLSKRTHIGKIVLSNFTNQDQVEPHHRVSKLNYKLKLNSSLIITGQSGISTVLIEWLLLHSNISDIIIISKSAMKWKLKLILNQFKDKIKVHYIQCDISNYDQLYSELKSSLPSTLPPIKSVLHLAANYNDVPMSEITQDTIESVHNPKVLGALNLHRLSIALGWNLSVFILFSSITGITGYPDQCVYNSANVILDAISSHRKVLGLPSFSINLGPMKSEGKVSSSKAISKLFKSRGLPSLNLNKLLALLEVIINNPNNLSIPSQLICSPISINNYIESFKNMNIKLSHLNNQQQQLSSGNDKLNGESIVSTKDQVLLKVSELLSIPISKINNDSLLKNYGLDSLTSIQLKSWIDDNFRKNLFNHMELSTITVNKLIEKINNLLDNGSNNNNNNNNNNNSQNSPVSLSSPITIIKSTEIKEVKTEITTPISTSSSFNSPLPLSIYKPILELNNLNDSNIPLLKKSLSDSSNSAMKTPPIINIRNLNNNLVNTPPLSSRNNKNNISFVSSTTIQQQQEFKMQQPNSQLSFKVNNNSFILGIGKSVPGNPISQDSLKEAISKDYSDDQHVNDKVKRIFDQTQIKTRHLVRDYTKAEESIKYRSKESISVVNEKFKQVAPDLAENACREAIKDWSGSIEDITHIMSVTSTGVVIPDVNFKLIQRLGLNENVERVSLNLMGCVAGSSAIRVSSQLAKASSRNRVLVVCTEICSLHFDNSNAESGDNMVASAIFADGSAAFIVGCNPKGNETPIYEVIASSCLGVPNTEHAMVWDLSKEGWVLGLDSSIPDIINLGIEDFINNLIKKSKVEISVKEFEFLVHTGGKSILDNVANALSIDSKTQMKNSWNIYSRYGNMSSASVIFVLDEARRNKNLPEYSISVAFGPGVTLDGSILRNLI